MFCKKKFFKRTLLKLCSINALLVTLLAINILILCCHYAISYYERKHFSFSQQLNSFNQTVVIIYGASEAAVTLLGHYLSSNFDSFYVKDPFQYLPNSSCPGMIIDYEVDWLKLHHKCDFQGMENWIAERYDKKPLDCSGRIQCMVYSKLHLFNNILECKLPNKEISISLNHPSASILSTVCRKSSLIVLLATKLCETKVLKDYLFFVNEQKLHTKIKLLHVTEDPRSVLYSLIKLKDKRMPAKALNDEAKIICGKIGKDVEFGNNFKESSKMSYLRLSLEEFQTRPKEIQQNLNQFIGENFATQMKCDLNPDLTKVNNQGIKYSRKISESWRNFLTIDEVITIQDMCVSVFKQLSYVNVYYKEDLQDIENIELF